MSLIIAIIVGAIIGWLAAAVAGRNEGLVGSAVIGIVGAIIGGFLSQLFTGGHHAYWSFTWSGIVWSFIGALILSVILNATQHRPRKNV